MLDIRKVVRAQALSIARQRASVTMTSGAVWSGHEQLTGYDLKDVCSLRG